MRAAYKEGRVFSIREIRLRIDACGVCGSDVHANPEQTAAASAPDAVKVVVEPRRG